MSDFVGMLMPSHSLQPRLGLLAMKLREYENAEVGPPGNEA